jgi:hypothetical protein
MGRVDAFVVAGLGLCAVTDSEVATALGHLGPLRRIVVGIFRWNFHPIVLDLFGPQLRGRCSLRERVSKQVRGFTRR